jgi:CRP/FNR family transcriptional regulator, cyclic AMP receptor protein
VTLTRGQVTDLIRGHPFFASLDAGAAASLAARASIRSVERGEIVLLEAEPAGPWCLVARGRIKLTRSSADGRELVLAFVGPGKAFNEVPALDGGPNPATAEAMTRAELVLLPASELRQAVRAHPSVTWAVVGALAGRLRQMTGLVEDLALRSVAERLAKLLLHQAEAVGEMTQSEMAAALGTVREVVARSLHALAEAGLIRIERHRILIADREALAQLAKV